jgi:hypothetical protein
VHQLDLGRRQTLSQLHLDDRPGGLIEAGPAMADPAIVERCLAAFGAADAPAMRDLLAPDLVAWVTNAGGAMDRVEGRDGYLERLDAMDLPAARFRVDLTQPPVPVESDKVLPWSRPRRAQRPHPPQLRRPPPPPHRQPNRRVVDGRRQTG